MEFRSKTIRLGIFISTVIVAAIIIFQLIWLRKVYNFEQKQFNHSIARTVRGFYEDMDLSLDQSFLNQVISSPNSQTFFVRLDRPNLDKDSIVFYMRSELEDEDVFTDCILGMYVANKQQYEFTTYLPGPTSSKKEITVLPPSGQSFDHLTLYFPHRTKYILTLMDLWFTGSIFLVLVLVLFGGSLYYFYREKFLNETQKDFVNNFTHEFRTPVSVINLAANVLARPDIAQKPEKLARYASIVQYQVNYLEEQIERLLHYTHAESTTLYLKKENVDFHALIAEALANLEPLIQSKGAKVEYRLEAERPVLQADKGHLLILITNLIENALKYSVNPHVIISTANQNNSLLFSVKDNGKGIDKKHQDKIFKKFYRVGDTEEMPARGFGLGLAFVKRIVQAHAGAIKLESVPGIGSDFRITLPLT
jgi:two-component system, OmpR family, phosphate regulon sensor histidine kinase PhoR